MESELLIARVALAVVFATAAVAKLVDPARTQESLAGFGVAERFRAPAALVLPLTELALAVLLVLEPTAVGAAIAAIVLLLAFSAAIARAIRRDERPDCNCFGQLGSRPVGWASLARNAVLAAVAVAIAAAGPGESVGQALSGVDAPAAVGVTALVLLLAAQAAFSYQLFRQNARLLERVRALEDGSRPARPIPEPRGLPPGSVAPWFELPDVSEQSRSLADLLAPGRALALAFLDPDCGACGPLLPRLARVRADGDGDLDVAIITRGTPADARRAINGHAFGAVLLQRDREVAEAYGVNGVPSAVLISPDGRIASEAVIGDLSVERLLRTRGVVVPEHEEVIG